MATRYYPAVKAPTALIHGPARGTWARQSAFNQSWVPVQWSWRLQTTKTNAGTQPTRVCRTNQQGDYDFYFTRWMTPPLSAQAIGGTFNLCTFVQARWDDLIGFSNASIVRYKLHLYLAAGQTTTVRQTLLDNYLDAADFPGTGGGRWRSLVAAQTLAAAVAQAGDVIVVEIGVRVVSSPVFAPTYPPTAMTRLDWIVTGANAALADAVDGDVSPSRAPWFEFSQTFTHEPVSAPPANATCATALVIPSLPHTSAFIDTSEAPGTDREVWWTWTASASDKVCVHTLGSNYGTAIAVFTGSCAGLSPVPFAITHTDLAFHRSQSNVFFDAVLGTQYWVRVRNTASNQNAPSGGGLARLGAFFVNRTPAEDDLYLPAGLIVAMRDGAIINLSAGLSTQAPTGLAIDYTRRAMDDLNGGTNSHDRLLVGLHNLELVEILDLPTLSYGDGQFEVDFIGDPWTVPGENLHPAQLAVTAAGMLHAGWFGNGYLFVVGQGTLPAILNTVSNNPDFSALKSIDATHGDNQPGAPFADTLRYPAIEVAAPWAIAIDVAATTLYYTSGGFYEPVGGQIVKRYDLVGDVQLADFAIVPLQGVNNPGLKGLQVIPGGGLLVCNGTVVERLDATGAVVQTYTPSVPLDSQSLCDVKLTADGLSFWTIDEATTRLFKFTLATGAEESTVQPYLRPGTLVQLAIYQPDGITPPEPPIAIEACPVGFDETPASGAACAADSLSASA